MRPKSGNGGHGQLTTLLAALVAAALAFLKRIVAAVKRLAAWLWAFVK